MVKIYLDDQQLGDEELEEIRLKKKFVTQPPVEPEPVPTEPEPVPIEPEPAPPAPTVLSVTLASDCPAEGAMVSGIVEFTVTGGMIANAEMVKPGTYDPKLAIGACDANGQFAIFAVDTKKFPNGAFAFIIRAYDKPAGDTTAKGVSTPTRNWTISNTVLEPVPTEPVPETPVPPNSAIEVTATQTTPPGTLDGPPKGWMLDGPYETFEQYPDGPLAVLPTPWYPKFSHNADYLNGDNEGQCYATPASISRGVTHRPFSVKTLNGKKWLGITARKTPTNELSISHNKPVQSGVMSNAREFLFGYMEAEFIMPLFKGSWAAWWCMGPSWFPEIDMIEHLYTPYGANKWFSNLHWSVSGAHKASGGTVALPGAVNVPFKSRCLWTPKFIAVYYNNQLVFSKPNPGYELANNLAHQVINLAVGGKASTWATPVDVNAMPQILYCRGLGQWKAPFSR